MEGTAGAAPHPRHRTTSFASGRPSLQRRSSSSRPCGAGITRTQITCAQKHRAGGRWQAAATPPSPLNQPRRNHSKRTATSLSDNSWGETPSSVAERAVSLMGPGVRPRGSGQGVGEGPWRAPTKFSAQYVIAMGAGDGQGTPKWQGVGDTRLLLLWLQSGNRGALIWHSHGSHDRGVRGVIREGGPHGHAILQPQVAAQLKVPLLRLAQHANLWRGRLIAPYCQSWTQVALPRNY